MRFITVIVSLFLSAQIYADSINLGQAADYNVFIKNDMNVSGSDAQGRVAVGGELSVSGGFEVGNKLTDYNMGTGPSLVVGKDINKTGWGQLSVYNTATLPTPVYGDAVLGGTVNDAIYQSHNSSTIGAATISAGSSSLPVNFDSAFAHLTNLSDQLASRTATSVEVSGNTLNFNVDPNVVPTDNVYVFNIDETMMQNVHGGARNTWVIDSANMANGATVVFNITNSTGHNVTLPASQVYLNSSATPLSNHFHHQSATNTSPVQVLYNFSNASQVELNGALFGSVLAPTADITSNSGMIFGQVVANSWASGNGNTQFNYNPFEPVGTSTPVTPVPEPGTVILFAIALLFITNRKKFIA